MASEEGKLLGEELATPLSRPYWDGLHAGALVLQRCASCGQWQHYPRRLCRSCWGSELAFARAGGSGALLAAALSHRTPKEALRERLPIRLGLVRSPRGRCCSACVTGRPRPGQGGRGPSIRRQTLASGLLTFTATDRSTRSR